LLSLTDGKSQTVRWNYDTYGRCTNKLDQANIEILRYQYMPIPASQIAGLRQKETRHIVMTMRGIS